LLSKFPPKVWRPKVKSAYIPITYADAVDDNFYLHKQFGKAHKSNPINDDSIPTHNDLQLWDNNFLPELTTNLQIGADATPEIAARIKSIIIDNWDAFFKAGVHQPILGFEFCIDISGAPLVCCHQPCYGPHKSRIIQQQVDALLTDGLIQECKGPWGSSIVLAPKLHQEDITDISQFKWCMCVSYQALNARTLPFEYPIPRCIDAIENLSDASAAGSISSAWMHAKDFIKS